MEPGTVGRPWLLRSWRVDVANMTGVDVAEALGVGRSTVANWEAGIRAPDAEALGALDRLYGAGGALVDLVAAMNTPQALEARGQWWHNYATGGGPVWAWARPGPGVGWLHLRVRWGPLGFELDQPSDERGLIITVPASATNPAAEAQIDPAGWVDFGQGPVPRQLPIPSLNALSKIRLLDPTDHALSILASRLRPALDRDGRWIDKLQALLGQRPDLIEDSLTRTKFTTSMIDLSHVQPTTWPAHTTWTGDRYRMLRQARGLSQSEAATKTTKLSPGEAVSDDQIALFEAGRTPRVADLPGRLDIIYRADGHTLCHPVPVTPGDGTHNIHLPRWWTGPVWLTPLARPSTPPTEILLRWPPWQHHLRVPPGLTLTTRKSPDHDQPLQVQLPPGWTLTAGIGAHPHAIDVNSSWQAISHHHANQIFNHYHHVYLDLFNKTRGQLIELLHRDATA